MALEIYKFRNDTPEWEAIRNSGKKEKVRRKMFDDYIKTTGTKVTLQEYFSDFRRDSLSDDGWFYQCYGEPKNIGEILALEEIDSYGDLNYIKASNSWPEDLTEGRVSWNEMKDYADGMACFISRIKSEIADGTLKFSKE